MVSGQKEMGYGKVFDQPLLWLLIYSGLIIGLALSCGVRWAVATEPVVLGNVVQSSAKAGTYTDITLAPIRKHMKDNGTAQIIVGLALAFTPEGELAASAVTQQRSEIARLQSVILGKVPSLKLKPEKIKRFNTSPFIALAVNAIELEALISLAEITSIEEDQLFINELVVPESK